jgi:hypothetical protein
MRSVIGCLDGRVETCSLGARKKIHRVHGVTTDYDEAFQFTGRQQLIHGSLVRKSQELADLYEAAIRVYSEQRNPCRLLLAAHSIREITSNLHKVFDLPIPVDPKQISDHASYLEPFWIDATKGECHQDGTWAGNIDDPLRKLLHKLHRFFEWLKENRGKRRLLAAQMFRGADPSGLALPETLEERLVARWLSLHRYFVGVAHGKSTTAEEFGANVEGFEKILIESVYRQPSEDLSVIDRILKEEANDA